MESVIAELRFEETLRYRPFALVAPEFVQLHTDQAEGELRSDGLRVTSESPRAPFAAVEVRVETTVDGSVVAGLASTDGDSAVAAYDFTKKRATIELSTSGRMRVAAVTSVALQPPFGFAFALCENQVTALADTGEGWQPLVTTQRNVASFLDFRDATVLRRFSYAYGVRASDVAGDTPAERGLIRSTLHRVRRPQPADRSTAQLGLPPDRLGEAISVVRAGLFGMAGVRDPHLVQQADGTPYVRDGRLYLTMTCAGPGFFQQAHWGVFTLDLDDLTKLEQVAQLYFTRDGLVLGDHAGQIIVDGDRFIVAVSSWGDFAPGNIHIRHTVTKSDVLSGVHVLPGEPLALPTSSGVWDPALTRIDDRWYLGFVESPSQSGRFDFHPALAVSAPGADYLGPFELIGADDSLHQCEGPILTLLQGSWRLLASDSDLAIYPMYDLDMRRVGTLDAPYLTNIPHPQVFPIDGPAGRRHLIVTFDGTQYGESVLGYGGHGDLVILEASPTDQQQPADSAS